MTDKTSEYAKREQRIKKSYGETTEHGMSFQKTQLPKFRSIEGWNLTVYLFE